MPETKSRPFAVILVAAALCMALSPRAAAQQQKEEKKKEARAAAQQSKPEREYQRVKQFGTELYNREVEFKNEVDEAFIQKRREHSEYAFNINTLDRDEGRRGGGGVAERMRVPDTLYDNPLAQDYVNRVGQLLVPADSTHLYAFKVTLNPIPEARSLSTGTVYVSTGLLARIDNEAQLAYVLAHEIGHVEKKHWFEDVLVTHAYDQFSERQLRKSALVGSIIGLTARTGGGFLSLGSLPGLTASMFASLSVPTLVKVAVPNVVITWDKEQEDEADRFGLQAMLAHNYDPREVPKFYKELQHALSREGRAALGFMADAVRVSERVGYVTSSLPALAPGAESALTYGAVNLSAVREAETKPAAPEPASLKKTAAAGEAIDPALEAGLRAARAEQMLGGEMSEEVRRKLEDGELIGSPAEFLAVMAELKRDNGIRAYYYDMFRVARDDLEESLQIRGNDPATHFFYGKVLKLTARTPGEKSRALSEFAAAIELDRRRMLPEAYLQRALMLVGSRDPERTREIVADLKEYVTLYQRQNAGQLPPNLDVIYNYMQDAGELTWAATPAVNVSTKNIEPLGVAVDSVAPAATPQPAAAAATQPVQNRQTPAVKRPTRRRP